LLESSMRAPTRELNQFGSRSHHNKSLRIGVYPPLYWHVVVKPMKTMEYRKHMPCSEFAFTSIRV
jgi:hypothetical protein